MTTLERIMQNVSPEPNTGCWLWLGADDGDGYGRFGAGKPGKSRLAHRVVYEFMRGDIPPGMQIDHLCRVRCCVNPDHLEIVTQQENIRRSPLIAQNGAYWRIKTHCPLGHPYDELNTYYIKSRGSRNCRICSKLNAKAYRERLKAKDEACSTQSGVNLGTA